MSRSSRLLHAFGIFFKSSADRYRSISNSTILLDNSNDGIMERFFFRETFREIRFIVFVEKRQSC